MVIGSACLLIRQLNIQALPIVFIVEHEFIISNIKRCFPLSFIENNIKATSRYNFTTT